MTALDGVAERLGALATRDAPLGARTTYRVGGTAALLVEVRTPSDLGLLADALEGVEVSILVVGRGSNLLVADGGFDGVAVVLAGAFETIDPVVDLADGTVSVRAGGAVALPVLARRCADQGLTGLEWGVGVPGSVGGAVRMNAGGHGDDTASSLRDAEVFDLVEATTSVRPTGSLDLAYRRSNLASNEVVTAATFTVARGDPTATRERVADVVRWRREHQPGGPNCGSVFQNPPDDHAARLIEAAGAKGRRHGTAMVSEKHANFIQADRDGRADDVAALIGEVRDLVRADSGVTLRTEVVFVGFGGCCR
ncbi:MAG TPA: UDP-N-acetylmuramate dehydrogenase [Acidimicrobiales bacterium]|nr:UDP-N-acetylmuramate dehydrogenase [Acidimicrobiales bacterium]